jgi:tRNA (guanosine-2'-O-)-methyltransferase
MSIKDQIDCLREFVTPERYALFCRIVQNRTRYFTAAVENIYQSHNASAVLRTCDCLGIQDVHVLEAANTFKVSEDVALGAEKWLTIKRYNNTGDFISELKRKNYRIVATSSHRHACMLPDFDISRGPAAFLFGTELQGLSEELMNEADEYLMIPMSGFTESYNISVSAAIILYTLMDKLKHSGISYPIDKGQKENLILAWLKKTVKDSDEILKRKGF